ncbi:ABC transporter permease [Chloroflexota bacterium]
MNLRRILILLGKEFVHGPKSFIFIWAIVAPLAFTLVATLAFGTLFSDKPELGIFDRGDSQLVAMSQGLDSINTSEYESIEDLRQSTESGAVDMGIVLPVGFDNAIAQGETVPIEAYIWGESLAKDRVTLPIAVADLVREIAGQEVPVEIESITLGEEAGTPWNERLLPFLVLMGVFFGGLMLPSTSLIQEKQKKTLEALIISPASIGEIFIAKGVLGITLSIFMGVAILLLNQVFGNNTLLLIGVLALGAVMAVEIGLILGVFIKDITTLFTVWKSGGIFLFGPAFIYIFPQIPEWIAKIFPTYYALQPVVNLSLEGGDWSSVAVNVLILVSIDVLFLIPVGLAARKLSQRS